MFSSAAKERGTVIAIAVEAPEGVASLSDGKNDAYHVVSDRGGRVSRLYGVLYALPSALVHLYQELGVDLPVRNVSARWELPVAATYVFNGEGVAVFAFVDADHARRAEPDKLLAVLAGLRSTPSAAQSL